MDDTTIELSTETCRKYFHWISKARPTAKKDKPKVFSQLWLIMDATGCQFVGTSERFTAPIVNRS